MGVTIVEGAEVNDFALSGSRVTAVRSAAGDYAADAFLLAAGAWTNSLAAMVGVDFPMQAGKGYSFFVEPSVVPSHSILLADVHVGCTPLGDQMRIGGTMEFSGLNTRLDERRIDDIAAGAKRLLQALEASAELESSAGPGCGRSRRTGCRSSTALRTFSNLFVATGYAMQGMTLAAPAGKAMAELITTGSKPAAARAVRDRSAARPATKGSARWLRSCAWRSSAPATSARDLLAKAGRSPLLEVVGMAGIDPDSAGLARAAEAGITTSHEGLADLLEKVVGHRPRLRRDLGGSPMPSTPRSSPGAESSAST